MAIRFTCPAGHRLKVPDEKAGRGMLCPVCQESVTVPDVVVADSDVDPSQPPPIEPSVDAIAHDQLPEAGTPTIDASVCGSAVRSRPRNSPPWGVAAGLLVVIAYSTLPALGHLGDAPMPSWVRAVLGMALLQTVFVIWMLIVRHWAAMRVVTLSFAAAAATYAGFAWFAIGTAMDQWSPRGEASRAAIWSATVLAVYLVTTYLCGVATRTWRLETFDER